MLLNYLMIALRNLARHRLYSFITIAGLAIGLLCAIFITLFVRNQTSYDRWLLGTENLYRLEMINAVPGTRPRDSATAPFMTPQAMHDEIPGVVAFTRLFPEFTTFNFGTKQFAERIGAVDPNFITFLNLPMEKGDAASALAQPQSVVLSQALARKFFGDDDPIGKVLTVSRPSCAPEAPACPTGAIALTVTGVFKDIPQNSQFAADVLLPNTSVADSYSQERKRDWTQPNTFGYLRLAPGADPQTVLTKLDPILDRELGPRLAQLGLRVNGRSVYLMHLTPFQRVHLNGARNENMTPPGDWATVYGVSAIGVLIMLMACFNFTNLAAAQAMLRAREAAVRKTLGARRSQLITQFLSEAVLAALFALVLAWGLEEALLPSFDNFLQQPIDFGLADWPVLALSIVIAVGAGLLSGLYPALILSGARPAFVLRGAAGGRGSNGLRNGVVVLQFAVSITLGISALVVFSQIDHARQVRLGFRHDNTVALFAGKAITVPSLESLMQQLAANPGIEAAAQSDDIPFTQSNPLAIVRLPGQSVRVVLNEMNIGPGFRALYGIPLLAGRDFVRDRVEDEIDIEPITLGQEPKPANEGHSVIFNEAAAARFGLMPRQAVGRAFNLNNAHVLVVGVIGDARFHGAREQAKPTIFFFDPNQARTISLRLRPDGLPDTLAFIDRTWRAFSPEMAVSRSFLDNGFQSLYSADVRQGQMFGLFVGLAIFIASLGLFGVAAFTAARRTKEIGLRKVFGAKTRDVIRLLLRQFSTPVVLANLIAWPLAWYYLNGWLQGFADRISLNPFYFTGVGVAALVVAWATVFVHTVRVARANPIKALRYE